MPVPSFSFNGINLGDYGVTLLSSDIDSMSHKFDTFQLEDKGISGYSVFQPLPFSFEVLIEPIRMLIFPPLYFQDVRWTLTFIREILNQRENCQLIFDNIPERFWLARFQQLSGKLIAPTVFKGTIDFVCPNPRSFAVDETISAHSIDTNPKIMYETVGGSAYTEPVYLLAAGENIPSAVVTLFNATTNESIQWSGSLAIGDELEIDVAHWVVKKNDIESMATVDGKFPRLVPGINTLQVSGFGITGTLQITYRNAYV